mgnify:CR=1 FL=1
MEYREEMMTQNFIREFDSLNNEKVMGIFGCLLYTSDAADDLLCVDLGGRRIIKKKTSQNYKQVSRI